MILLPLALGHRASAFATETAERAALPRAALPPDRARSMTRVDVQPTPYDVVYRENELERRHYEPRGDRRHDEPVVSAYAFVNTPAILDLEPSHSVVGQFLDAVPSDDTEVFEFPTGHVGTFVDPAAHDEWWPRVRDRFERRPRAR